jgi:hypothetical protein
MVEQCRNLIIDECSGLLSNMFNELEPAFLGGADGVSHQAEKISARSAFMEALATIEKQKPEITNHFQQQLAQGFNRFIECNTSTTTTTHGPEIEDDIEIRKMAFEGRNLYFKQLYELRHRMALLRKGKKIEEKELPGGPSHIVSSFYSAITMLDLDRQFQVTLYKLFDNHVMSDLSTTYDHYNSLLIDAGLFPNLKPISTQLPSEEADTQTAEPPVTETIDRIQDIDKPAWTEEETSTWMDSAHDDISIPGYDAEPHNEADDHTPSEKCLSDIIEALNRIQPLTSASIDAHSTMLDDTSTPEEIDEHLTQDLRKSLANDEKQLFDGIGRQNFSTVQISTIKLVRLIFEQIIDSPLLPGASKALICSLHVPYLKIAILDQGLFNQGNHPARELLNLVISCGGQWVDEFNLQKGIYPKLSEAVDHILFDFNDNTQLFDELLTELKDAVQKLVQKIETVEQRAQESARGRDRLDSTRHRVTEIIQEHTQGQQLANPIRQFLKGAWSDRLTLMLLRDPGVLTSPTWQEALDMIDALSAMGSSGSIDEVPIETRQDMENKIKNNMSLLGDYQSEDLDNLCRFLAGEGGDSNQGISSNLAGNNEAPASSSPLNEKEQRILKKLLKLEPGTWFELFLNGDRKAHRVKLSWRSDTSSNHMFVDQSGAQVAMIPAETLARDLCAGSTHILGHYRIPFVDKAIKDIGDHFKSDS